MGEYGKENNWTSLIFNVDGNRPVELGIAWDNGCIVGISERLSREKISGVKYVENTERVYPVV
jgi:hypothetical protein